MIVLMAINASLLRIPQPHNRPGPQAKETGSTTDVAPAAPDYKPITERNLFRAKLEVEIPKPKSAKEIEEELLTGILRTMVLKGIMTGSQKKDDYAVIDRGGQKGVWTYEVGDVIESGLAVKEIRKDTVVLHKGDFGALLRLFAMNAERIPITPVVAPQSIPNNAPDKKGLSGHKTSRMPEIKRDGKTVVIPKLLAEQIKNDNSALMSSVAVKIATDSSGRPTGYKVVAMNKDSIAGKMGLKTDDTLQSVNGRSLSSGEDLKKLYDDMKNATRFELKVMRQGKPETIFYEIR